MNVFFSMTTQIGVKDLGISCFLYCYATWDDMDKVFKEIIEGRNPETLLPCEKEQFTLKGFPEAQVMRGFNNIDVPYPFVIAIAVKKEVMKDLDAYLCESKIDFKSPDSGYAGVERFWEFLSFVPITRYPPGFLKIQFGRCEMKAKSSMVCTFCQMGHITECHYPYDHREAKCSHYTEEEGF